MKSRRLTLLTTLSFVLLCLISQPVLSQSINSNAGSSAYSFLKINTGGRAVGMGGAFTGLANDESALYYNPAGLVGFETNRFLFGYHNYIADMQSGTVGFIKAIDIDHSLAFHIDYLNFGEFIETNKAGDVTGTFSGGDILFATSYAFKKTRYLSLGATFKVIYEKIQSFTSTGLAVDLGAKYHSDRGRYSAGLILQNLGAQLSSLGTGESDGLPTTVRMGGSARPRGLNAIINSDIIIPFDNDIDFAFGIEFFGMKPLYLRLGWNSFGSNYRHENSDNGLAGISFGVGFDYRHMHLSYAITPAADLGESHRITLTGGM